MSQVGLQDYNLAQAVFFPQVINFVSFLHSLGDFKWIILKKRPLP
jgi:hypothetical protein